MAKLVIGTDKTVGTPAIVKIPVEKYPLMSRVKDDNNVDIGCVVCYHTDANNQKYAVVCLNAQYRNSAGQMTMSMVSLPIYDSPYCFTAKETATYNCDVLINEGRGGTAVSHCRSKVFTINNIQYAGQLPNIWELVNISALRLDINSSDPTATDYPSLVLGEVGMWASTKGIYGRAYDIRGLGTVTVGCDNTNFDMFIVPVLEIPID